jgi:hypothetical protein
MTDTTRKPNCNHETDDTLNITIPKNGVDRRYCIQCLVEVLDKAFSHDYTQSTITPSDDSDDYDRAMKGVG